MKKRTIFPLLLCLLMLVSCGKKESSTSILGSRGDNYVPPTPDDIVHETNRDMPAYTGNAYDVVNNNDPYFTEADWTTESFETYSELDSLGRCGVAYACIGQDLMPTEKRGDIGSVKPSGWQTVKYDCVDGKYLYNRCHLIGYQLTAENANKKNLITGTRYLNIEGMLPFENMVADYIKETGNHVLYRVTPVFTDANLVSDGVLMEGYSVEDEGAGICYCVFAHNVQPGVVIDYGVGISWLEDGTLPYHSNEKLPDVTYVGNTKSFKFHTPNCPGLDKMSDSNRVEFYGNRQEVVDAGYEPCARCCP